jgi:hypothetical protein
MASRQHDAPVVDPLDLGQSARAGRHRVAALEDAVDALDQPLESVAVNPVGAAETMDHPRLGTLGFGVPGIFGQGVIGDCRAVLVPPLGDPQVHAYEIS